jgi:hypothetical protein
MNERGKKIIAKRGGAVLTITADKERVRSERNRCLREKVKTPDS